MNGGVIAGSQSFTLDAQGNQTSITTDGTTTTRTAIDQNHILLYWSAQNY